MQYLMIKINFRTERYRHTPLTYLLLHEFENFCIAKVVKILIA